MKNCFKFHFSIFRILKSSSFCLILACELLFYHFPSFMNIYLNLLETGVAAAVNGWLRDLKGRREAATSHLSDTEGRPAWKQPLEPAWGEEVCWLGHGHGQLEGPARLTRLSEGQNQNMTKTPVWKKKPETLRLKKSRVDLTEQIKAQIITQH